MKATIDIPDDLFRRVEEKSALQGRPVDAVVTELIRRGLDEAPADVQGTESTRESSGTTRLTRRQRVQGLPTPEWLERLRRSSEEAFKDALPGPTAREILEQDRGRLDYR